MGCGGKRCPLSSLIVRGASVGTGCSAREYISQLPGSWLYAWNLVSPIRFEWKWLGFLVWSFQKMGIFPPHNVCLLCPGDAQWLEQGLGGWPSPWKTWAAKLRHGVGWVGQCQEWTEESSHPTQWNRKNPFKEKNYLMKTTISMRKSRLGSKKYCPHSVIFLKNFHNKMFYSY